MRLGVVRILIALAAGVAVLLVGLLVLAVGQIEDGLGPVGATLASAIIGLGTYAMWRGKRE